MFSCLEFSPGDHLKVRRTRLPFSPHLPCPPYTHHGIYVGNDEVVHYLEKGLGVSKTSFQEFSDGATAKKVVHDSPPHSPAEVVQRALDKLGEDEYSLFTNNCEHFCNWCVEGKKRSGQVRKAAATVGGLILTVVTIILGGRKRNP